MRKFVCSPYGEEVDLDNSETYSYLPNDANQLRDILFKDFGWSQLYMNYLHPDVFSKNDNQRLRINEFMKKYSENHLKNYDNLIWLKEQVFLFQDEIENMC
jgi:hypothetical protein